MKITFDTDADSIDDLKNVMTMLNNALQKREIIVNNGIDSNRTANNLPSSSNEIFNVGKFVEAPKQEQFASGRYQQQTQQQNQPNSGKTAGGGRVIPYQDMSSMMSNIFSNQSTRRTK